MPRRRLTEEEIRARKEEKKANRKVYDDRYEATHKHVRKHYNETHKELRQNYRKAHRAKKAAYDKKYRAENKVRISNQKLAARLRKKMGNENNMETSAISNQQPTTTVFDSLDSLYMHITNRHSNALSGNQNNTIQVNIIPSHQFHANLIQQDFSSAIANDAFEQINNERVMRNKQRAQESIKISKRKQLEKPLSSFTDVPHTEQTNHSNNNQVPIDNASPEQIEHAADFDINQNQNYLSTINQNIISSSFQNNQQNLPQSIAPLTPGNLLFGGVSNSNQPMPVTNNNSYPYLLNNTNQTNQNIINDALIHQNNQIQIAPPAPLSQLTPSYLLFGTETTPKQKKDRKKYFADRYQANRERIRAQHAVYKLKQKNKKSSDGSNQQTTAITPFNLLFENSNNTNNARNKEFIFVQENFNSSSQTNLRLTNQNVVNSALSNQINHTQIQQPIAPTPLTTNTNQPTPISNDNASYNNHPFFSVNTNQYQNNEVNDYHDSHQENDEVDSDYYDSHEENNDVDSDYYNSSNNLLLR